MSDPKTDVTPGEYVHRRNNDECFVKHKRWTDEYLGSRIKVLVGSMLLGMLAVGLIVFGFVSKFVVALDNDRDDQRYVLIQGYDKDQMRIQSDLKEIKNDQKELGLEMKSSFKEISKKLDDHALDAGRTP